MRVERYLKQKKNDERRRAVRRDDTKVWQTKKQSLIISLLIFFAAIHSFVFAPHARCYILQGKRAGFGLVMDDVLSGADIDIYGLADATRRRANGLSKASHVDGSVLNRNDLATAVRARPDLKVSEGMRPK